MTASPTMPTDSGPAESASETTSGAPEAPVSTTARGSTQRTKIALATMALVSLGLAALCGLQWTQLSDERDRNRDLAAESISLADQDAVLEQANAIAVDLTTYDWRDLESQQVALSAQSTQKFQDTFAESKLTLDELFTELQAVASGTVADSAVKSLTDDEAVVLLYVDQQARSKDSVEPETQFTRVRMTLLRSGGEWLLDQVDLV